MGGDDHLRLGPVEGGAPGQVDGEGLNVSPPRVERVWTVMVRTSPALAEAGKVMLPDSARKSCPCVAEPALVLQWTVVAVVLALHAAGRRRAPYRRRRRGSPPWPGCARCPRWPAPGRRGRRPRPAPSPRWWRGRLGAGPGGTTCACENLTWSLPGPNTPRPAANRCNRTQPGDRAPVRCRPQEEAWHVGREADPQ